MDGLMAAIRESDPELAKRIDELEILEKEIADCVSAVDLDIAFSPVILRPGGSLDEAVEVAYKGEDGRYVITEPFQMVSEEKLKIMRARYLVTRGREMAPFRQVRTMAKSND
jgi:hypothetical protein